jgi:putative SOS response-associated peptidase YedK
VCGRYTLTVPLSNLVDFFEVPPPAFEIRPRYNIAPSQEVPIVAQDSRGRRMGLLRWGLVPSWAKDPSIGNRLINARSETVGEKPAFRSAFGARRCLVPADGFFEWMKEGEPGRSSGKTPYWIHGADGAPLAFAGLWERWGSEDQGPLHTFTILTTEAGPTIMDIHPRMPVILSRELWGSWLDPSTDLPSLSDLLRSAEIPSLSAHPVSSLVNSPGNDLPACVVPVEKGNDPDF